MPPAFAQQSIGSAASTHNEVSREIDGAVGRLSAGDSVYSDEIVLTGAESTAKLIFRDSTNLAVGPTSRVQLDRFVYDAEPSSQAMSVKLTKGVFRFSTGSLDEKAYQVETRTAAIGVRGAVLDIDVGGARTNVTLVEGKALVCPRRKNESFEQLARDCWQPSGMHATGRHCDCIQLQQPGLTASVSGRGGGYGQTPVDFAALCAGDPALCSSNNFAEQGGGGVSGAVLCGR